LRSSSTIVTRSIEVIVGEFNARTATCPASFTKKYGSPQLAIR
jgi:hypothetical protein